jgi:glycosyltransferase involved in cell wall biosynthesis
LKILLVAPQPFYALRGTPIAVRQVVETLCQAGHQVDLLVYHAGEDIQIPGMRLIRAGRPPGVGHVPCGISVQKLVCDLWLISRMVGLLRRNRYDVVHAVEEAVFPAALMNRLSRGPRLIYDMDSSLSEQLTDKWRALKPLRRLFETLERSVVRRSDATLAVCEELADKVRPWTDADRVTVLPDVPDCGEPVGAQVESLRDRVPAGGVLGLYVGNLEGYQGVDLLLDGLALVEPEMGFCLIVIGGEERDIERYRARAASLSLEGRVFFLGKRPLAYLTSYLAQADVLISPRRLGANTPMKIYWYLQAGKPILATAIRSHLQVLDDNCAQLVAPNAASIAEGIRQLARDAELRAKLGGGAAERAARACSRDAFRQRLLMAYHRAMLPSLTCILSTFLTH